MALQRLPFTPEQDIIRNGWLKSVGDLLEAGNQATLLAPCGPSEVIGLGLDIRFAVPAWAWDWYRAQLSDVVTPYERFASEDPRFGLALLFLALGHQGLDYPQRVQHDAETAQRVVA